MIDDKLLAKAILLHDVGKLVLRAGLADEDADHTQLGVEWLRSFLPVDNSHSDEILHCLAYHHKNSLINADLPSDDPSYIVYAANTIAIGYDRDESETFSSNFDITKPLESIFNHFSCKTNQRRYFSPKEQDVTKEINYSVENRIKATPTDYQRLLVKLANSLAKKSLLEFEPFEVLQLVEDIMSYIPHSIIKGRPSDISLYEHQKVACSLGACINRYFLDNNITNYKDFILGKGQPFKDEELFLVVAGDISGIQNFIYSIPSDIVFESIRGRSFYLDILLENIVDEFLLGLKLPRANFIYAGGGHFYFLAPNTVNTRAFIESFAEKINNWFLQMYGTQIYLAIGTYPCTPKDFMAGANGNDAFAKADEAVGSSKLNRYSTEVLANLFTPESKINKNEGVYECAVCHAQTSRVYPYGSLTDVKACWNCNALLLLGKILLAREVYFVISTDHFTDGIPVPGHDKDLWLYLLQEESYLVFLKLNAVVRVYCKHPNSPAHRSSFRLRMSDYFARDEEGRALTLNELADKPLDGDYSGIRRLGVFSADIDHFGTALKNGFYRPDLKMPFEFMTFTRQIVLSTRVTFFFKNILDRVCSGELQGADGSNGQIFTMFKKPQHYKRSVHVFYAGGDDIFLLGPWDDIMEVSIDLNRAFSCYTNGKLALSAGIGIFSPKYPIRQMAKKAEILKRTAKHIHGDGNIALFARETDLVKTPRISYFNYAFEWRVFEQEVCEEKLKYLADTFYFGETAILDKVKTSRSTLFKLRSTFSESAGGFNLASFAYILSSMRPQREDAISIKVYDEFCRKLYSWSRDDAERSQLLTALDILLYSMKDVTREGL